MNASRRVLRALAMIVTMIGLVFGGLFVALSPAGAQLTSQQCADLIAAGDQARADLQKLLEAAQSGSVNADTSDPSVQGYLDELVTDAEINEFGFVTGDAGAPLDICIPGGSVTVVLDGTITLWEGIATDSPFPLTVFIPAGLACGTHTLTASGTDTNGAPISQTVSFEVVNNCSTGTTLPVTGADAGRMLVVAAGLIILGGAALYGARRQARSA